MKHKLLLVVLVLLVMAMALAACGGGGAERVPQESPSQPAQEQQAAPAGDAVAGKEKFAATCSACHGPEGKGVEGLGKDMTSSEFIAGKTDAELLDFIKVGRDPSDPMNTTGVAMPPKGGNPALNDDDLMDIIAFIRTIHQ